MARRVLVVCVAALCMAALASAEMLTLCAPPSNGFTMLRNGTEIKPPVLFRGVNDLSQVVGFDVDMRRRIAGVGQFPEIRDENIELIVWGSFSETVFWTRIGRCNISLAPFTITQQRHECNCGLPTDSSLNVLPSEEAYYNLNFEQSRAYSYSGVSGSCCVDFSKPVLQTAVSVLVREELGQEESNIAALLVRLDLVNALLGILSATFVAAHIIWLIERRKGFSTFPYHYVDGIDEALWWAVVTVTTVGYGDQRVRSRAGRIFGTAWMFVGILSFGIFSGLVTSQLTEQALKSTISELSDMTGLKVCASNFYAAADEVRANPVIVVEPINNSLADCFKKFEANQVDGVITDVPILAYYAAHQSTVKKTRILRGFLAIDLAYIFPKRSPLINQFDISFLNVTTHLEDRWFDQTLVDWFGTLALTGGFVADSAKIDQPLNPIYLFVVVGFFGIIFLRMLYNGVLFYNKWRHDLHNTKRSIADQEHREHARVEEHVIHNNNDKALQALYKNLMHLVRVQRESLKRMESLGRRVVTLEKKTRARAQSEK